MLRRNGMLLLFGIVSLLLVGALALSSCVGPDGTVYGMQPIVAAEPAEDAVLAANKALILDYFAALNQDKSPATVDKYVVDEVLKHQKAGKPLVDVRSPGEYTGELLHMPDYPQEGALRGGHIPGACNVPWSRAANDDGTFKSPRELEKLYSDESGLKRRAPIVAYCRIGERSSHTWFVLHYLLGYPKVKNYDGSWTEWGNAVGVPIEKGPGSTSVRPEPAGSGS